MYGNTYNYVHFPMFRQRISSQQAQEIALKRVPGQIIHVDMDLENGVMIYEVFILTPQNKIVEVDVVAKSGMILKIEEENDFD